METKFDTLLSTLFSRSPNVLRRYFTPTDLQEQTTIRIEGDTFHHVVHVCREGLGSRFELLSRGKAYTAEITRLEKKSAHAVIQSVRVLPPLPDPQINLCLSVPKFPTFEAVLEKCSELGVARVRPFLSDYSAIRKNTDLSPAKTLRWKKILEQSYQQTGRGIELEIAPLEPLLDLLHRFKQTKNCFGLFAYEGPSNLTVSNALRSLNKSHSEAWIFVGSEGGFSGAEVELFSSHGPTPASLGPQILRVETACITLVSVLKYERERRDS